MSAPRVALATLKGHQVVAVDSSSVPSKPWTAVDVVKGWSHACCIDELVDPVWLVREDVVEGLGWVESEPVVVTVRTEYSHEEAIVSVREMRERLFAPFPATTPKLDRWRIESALLDGETYEGSAPEVWGQLVSAIDGGWSADAIEQLVDGSWRRRSVRDLLDAAGGDPL